MWLPAGGSQCLSPPSWPRIAGFIQDQWLRLVSTLEMNWMSKVVTEVICRTPSNPRVLWDGTGDFPLPLPLPWKKTWDLQGLFAASWNLLSPTCKGGVGRNLTMANVLEGDETCCQLKTDLSWDRGRSSELVKAVWYPGLGLTWSGLVCSSSVCLNWHQNPFHFQNMQHYRNTNINSDVCVGNLLAGNQKLSSMSVCHRYSATDIKATTSFAWKLFWFRWRALFRKKTNKTKHHWVHRMRSSTFLSNYSKVEIIFSDESWGVSLWQKSSASLVQTESTRFLLLLSLLRYGHLRQLQHKAALGDFYFGRVCACGIKEVHI